MILTLLNCPALWGKEAKGGRREKIKNKNKKVNKNSNK